MKRPRIGYVARPGSTISDRQARVIGPELERIERANGCLKPPEVVEEARPEDSKLHGFFTWSNSKAAELYRQEEARQLIRSVVLITVENEETPPARGFVSVTSKLEETRFEGRGYISSVRAMTDESYREQVLQTAYDELQQFREKYKHLKELGVILAAIETLVPA